MIKCRARQRQTHETCDAVSSAETPKLKLATMAPTITGDCVGFGARLGTNLYICGGLC